MLAIDLQNDFMPGGALAVPHGDEVIAPINRLAAHFPHMVLTQDWHPATHRSFAVNHAGRAPFDSFEMPYGPQVLWPSHCVQGTPGAALDARLQRRHARMLIRKGHRPEVDSYSAFVEADRVTSTGLAGYLRECGVEHVFCCGLATDFCVAFSALDARAAGFAVTIIEDACRAIDLDGSLEQAWTRLTDAGVARCVSNQLLD